MPVFSSLMGNDDVSYLSSCSSLEITPTLFVIYREENLEVHAFINIFINIFINTFHRVPLNMFDKKLVFR